MNTRIQLLCVWAGPVFLVLYALSFLLAGFLPPHAPALSAEQVSAFYDLHRNQTRAGLLLCMIFSMLLFPWYAVISAQMARIERGFPVLALIQFGAGALLIVFFVVCSMMWIVAAWQPDLDPSIVKILHDGSWLVFVMVFPEYCLQLSCIAVVGLMDKRAQPWLPRWACYFNLWVAFTGIGGGLATFFRTGPFAWNGLIGFWLPVIFFTIWLFVMATLTYRSVRREAPATQAAGTQLHWSTS